MKRVAAMALLVACRRAPAPSCTIELSGNYAETSAMASCAKLGSGAGATRGDTLLKLDLPSRTLGGSYAITIDLGARPTPGSYNSGTTELWSASGIEHRGSNGACLFQAGNNATPTGDFSLDVTAIDRGVHGTLALRMAVLARVSDDGKQTDCGRVTTEQLQLRF